MAYAPATQTHANSNMSVWCVPTWEPAALIRQQSVESSPSILRGKGQVGHKSPYRLQLIANIPTTFRDNVRAEGR